jgi:hypothetical protein
MLNGRLKKFEDFSRATTIFSKSRMFSITKSTGTGVQVKKKTLVGISKSTNNGN